MSCFPVIPPHTLHTKRSLEERILRYCRRLPVYPTLCVESPFHPPTTLFFGLFTINLIFPALYFYNIVSRSLISPFCFTLFFVTKYCVNTFKLKEKEIELRKCVNFADLSGMHDFNMRWFQVVSVDCRCLVPELIKQRNFRIHNNVAAAD